MARTIKRSRDPFTYVLESDRKLDPSEQSRFTLNPLSGEERASTLDQMTTVLVRLDGSREVLDHSWRLARSAILRHLVAVENFPVGDPRSWPAGEAYAADRDRYLDQLPDLAVRELYNELLERSWKGDPPAAAGAASSTPTES